MDRMIRIFDTTLRDGEQAPGCSMDMREKLEVARALERLRVDAIEAGFAVSSPGDFESVQRIAAELKHSSVGSLARCVKGDIDAAWDAVKVGADPFLHVFISTSPLHMEYKLKKTPEQVLAQAVDAVKYARSKCSTVEFSCEDATRSDRAFLKEIVEAAIDAGASIINIPDTVGYAVPSTMADLFEWLFANVRNADKVIFSAHCHDDLGMAVANSIAAISAGATQVECSINGIGERAGNAALEEIAMAIHTRRDALGVQTNIDTTQLYRASNLVYGIVGMAAPINKAIVGTNAFAHESGIHQHGMLANRETYEIMTPESVGLTTSTMVLGKHSGRAAIFKRVEELGYELEAEQADKLFEEFKALADRKKSIDDHDLEALIASKTLSNGGTFKLVRFDLTTGNMTKSSCTVQLEVDGELVEDVALGNGPVNAAYNAIDKLVDASAHGQLAPTRKLEDYQIRSVGDGEDALGEVVVKVRSGSFFTTGRGLSVDVMEASVLAYINGINKLIEMGERQASA